MSIEDYLERIAVALETLAVRPATIINPSPVSAPVEPPADEPVQKELSPRQKLMARLDELGISYNKTSNMTLLRSKLDAYEAAKATPAPEPEAPAPEPVQAPAPEPEAPAPEPVQAPAKAYTMAEVQTALGAWLMANVKAVGLDAAHNAAAALLEKAGGKKLSDISPDKYPALMAEIQQGV